VAERLDHPKEHELLRDGLTVAGLDLDGRDALLEVPLQSSDPDRDELFLALGPGRGDGGSDAAAGGRDGEIASTGTAQGELVRAVAREDQMGVRVDEPRGNHRSARIDDFAPRKEGNPRVGVGARPYPDDRSIARRDGARSPDPRCVVAARRGSLHGAQLTGAPDQEIR
jgi:hypothetical protein